MNELLLEIYKDIAQPIIKQARFCLLISTNFRKSFVGIHISDKCKEFFKRPSGKIIK